MPKVGVEPTRPIKGNGFLRPPRLPFRHFGLSLGAGTAWGKDCALRDGYAAGGLPLCRIARRRVNRNCGWGGRRRGLRFDGELYLRL